MADPVQGSLEVQAEPGGETRIVLDPATADITAGGNGGMGDVIVKNGDGKEVIRIGRIQETTTALAGKGGSVPTRPTVVADYTGVRVRSGTGVNLVQIGRMNPSGSSVNPPDDIGIIFGGKGFSARLSVVDKDGDIRVVMGQDNQGNEGRLVIFSPNGKEILEFDPEFAALYVGGEGNEGDVIVRDEANRERIKLDAGEGDIWVRDAGGNNLLHFDSGNAALYVGGQGNEGDVIVRDEANRERIKLDAGEGDIWVRDAGGNNLLHFDSGYAALYVGGQGNEGDVILRNDQGAETIKLDGGLGDIILSNADCAEEFDVAELAEPGTVMVIDDDERLTSSTVEYDRRVAGVVSGAGSYRPGIVLDRRADAPDRPAVALVGKVHCRVDATYSPISVGDLLVSSSTPGHAMHATDATRRPGAVLGKALRGLAEGRGLIPILVTLQ